MMSPINTPWDEEMTSDSTTFEVITGSVTLKEFTKPNMKETKIREDEVMMDRENPFSDTYSPKKESMKGSTMFWWAFWVSLYLYCGYIAINTITFRQMGVLHTLLDNNDWRALPLMMFITMTTILSLGVLMWFFCFGGINYINKLLDKILK